MFAKLSHEQFCRYHCQTQTPSSESPSVIRCFAPLCSVHSRGGGTGSGDQLLPRLNTLASNLVRWVEARAKLDALYAVFLGRGPVFHALPLMSPAFSIMIEMENLQQITTRNTAVFPELSLHEPTSLILVLSFLPFMELFRSLLPGYSELYHYHLLWIHGPQKYIWSEV